MIQLYFRDIRRRVERQEERYLPNRYGPVEICWVDEDGRVTMIAGPNRNWMLDEEDDDDPGGGLTKPTDSNSSDYPSGDARISCHRRSADLASLADPRPSDAGDAR